MFQQIIRFFTSAFSFPGLGWELVLTAIAIGVIFGAIWLIPYWPPVIKRPGLCLVGVISAFLTWTAIALIQIPLQVWTGQALLHFWDQITLTRWLLLAGIPQILLSGLVQEGAKLVPVILYWRRNQGGFTPKFGLIAGAVSGAGFGVFEAIWIHNTIFASGWTWNAVEMGGLLALLGFWERFFSVAFHTAASALAGYGLARGLGWQFYLIASFLHGATNYSVVLLQKGTLTTVQVEMYLAFLAASITAAALWLRWRKPEVTDA
ncbi:MAG: PrsW family intramembrane metalloprotease [Chloroflexi bacterium]|nr:PrsW family intramembrane metalloprotease [Chloroflexota bacterium]